MRHLLGLYSRIVERLGRYSCEYISSFFRTSKSEADREKARALRTPRYFNDSQTSSVFRQRSGRRRHPPTMSLPSVLRARSVASASTRLFSSTCHLRKQDEPPKPPQPPKPIDDSTSALEYKRFQRSRPPPLPAAELPRSRSAEEAVTNILYNTPPPNLQPFKKYVSFLELIMSSTVT